MWIILRLLIGISLLLAVELYFLKKTNLSVRIFFPKFYQNKYPLIRRIFLIWLNLYPIVLLIIYIYFAISGEYISSPDNKLIDYLYDSFEGKEEYSFEQFREIAMKFLSDIRKDIGIYQDEISYSGNR